MSLQYLNKPIPEPVMKTLQELCVWAPQEDWTMVVWLPTGELIKKTFTTQEHRLAVLWLIEYCEAGWSVTGKFGMLH